MLLLGIKGNKMSQILPCKQCLKFPLCRDRALKEKVFYICDDLFHYMHRKYNSEAFIEMNNYYLYLDEENKYQTQYNKDLYIDKGIWI
jgi:hypothetical protein